MSVHDRFTTELEGGTPNNGDGATDGVNFEVPEVEKPALQAKVSQRSLISSRCLP